MKRIRLLGLPVVVIAAAATPACANGAEGPFYSLAEGGRIGGGQSLELSAKASMPFILKSNVAKAKIECKSLESSSGGSIGGSSGANASTGKGVLAFSECSGGGKEESLSTCEPEGGRVTTNEVTSTLGYSSSTRTGDLLVSYKPSTGSTLATIKFVGSNCLASTTSVTGTAVGEVFSGGKVVEVGTNETDKAVGEIHFATPERTIWTESAGVLSSSKVTLSAFGTAATLTGDAELELASQESWGVRTSGGGVGERAWFIEAAQLSKQTVKTEGLKAGAALPIFSLRSKKFTIKASCGKVALDTPSAIKEKVEIEALFEFSGCSATSVESCELEGTKINTTLLEGSLEGGRFIRFKPQPGKVTLSFKLKKEGSGPCSAVGEYKVTGVILADMLKPEQSLIQRTFWFEKAANSTLAMENEKGQSDKDGGVTFEADITGIEISTGKTWSAK